MRQDKCTVNHKFNIGREKCFSLLSIPIDLDIFSGSSVDMVFHDMCSFSQIPSKLKF